MSGRAIGVAALILGLTAGSLGAQVPGVVPGGGGPQTIPPRADSATPGMGVNLDPIGTILERRDSLRLADSVVRQLVQLNLRLFRRNRTVQMRIDSLVPPAGGGGALARPASRPSDEVMARIGPLVAQLRTQSQAARDTALTLLTPEQRDKLEAWERDARRAGMRRRMR